MCKSTRKICWFLPSEKSNLPVISSVASLVVGDSCVKVCHVCLDDLWRDNLYAELSSGVASPCLKFEWHCLKAVENNVCVSGAFLPSLKKNLMLHFFPSYRPLENYGLHLIGTAINVHWVIVCGVMTAELTRLTQIIAVLWRLVAESCTVCSGL